MDAIEKMMQGSSEFTVILWSVEKMSQLFYPRADDINSAIRKTIAFVEETQGAETSWWPLFAWHGRKEPDYSCYCEGELDWLLEGCQGNEAVPL